MRRVRGASKCTRLLKLSEIFSYWYYLIILNIFKLLYLISASVTGVHLLTKRNILQSSFINLSFTPSFAFSPSFHFIFVVHSNFGKVLSSEFFTSTSCGSCLLRLSKPLLCHRAPSSSYCAVAGGGCCDLRGSLQFSYLEWQPRSIPSRNSPPPQSHAFTPLSSSSHCLVCNLKGICNVIYLKSVSNFLPSLNLVIHFLFRCVCLSVCARACVVFFNCPLTFCEWVVTFGYFHHLPRTANITTPFFYIANFS